MLLAVAALVSLPISTASATLLVIEFTGLSLKYDGTNIFDVGGPGGGAGDPGGDVNNLTSMAFSVDNTLMGVLTENLAADFFIPSIFNIPVGGGAVSTVIPGGFFDLLTNATNPGYGLALDIESFDVFYTGFEIAVFGRGVAVEVDQDLPFGLMVVPGDEVSISFSTQIDVVTDDGAHLETFEARGTGEVRAMFVPEPGTLTLALLGCLATLLMIARKR